MLLIAAISADEWLGSLFGYTDKRPVAAFSKRVIKQDIKFKQMSKVFRVYMSAILTMLMPYKSKILEQMQLSEADFIRLWCDAFQYGPDDMELFDSSYLPSFQARGIDGLIEVAGQQLFEGLYGDSDSFSTKELEALKNVLVDDLAAILRNVGYKPE